jgi:probable F420-dependent oxidoreductase
MKFAQAMIGAQPTDWNRIAVACEEAGFDSVAVSDHMVFPGTLDSKYPYTPDGTPLFSPDEDWPDPWVAIASMAASTTTLRFFTNVFILPLRNPFVVAKAVGTAAVMSGNRVSLGIGAGWMAEEFRLAEQPFAKRGKRLDEMVDVMRTLWKGGMVEHHGEFYDFDPVEMRPAPTADVPVLVGGHSDVAFRRAAKLGDGWIGVHYPVEELLAHCESLQQAREDAGTADRPFEIIASPLAVPSTDLVEQLESVGVTTILTSAWMAQGLTAPDVDRACEMIRTYGERFIRA